ncbi:MAG: hypothetical protein K8R46_10905 [Pirellulales bacterium]|nr:hypothetical protein [Pirellulales bacterium]
MARSRRRRRGQSCPATITTILRTGFDLGLKLPTDPRDNPEPLRVFWSDPNIRDRVEQEALEHGAPDRIWARRVFGE